jgi:tetratricopeptide (TPR) repeat protein
MMPVPAKRFAAICLIACVALSPTAWGQDAQALSTQAGSAYEAKNFAKAADLYVAAAHAGPAKATNLYNAACSYALAGQTDAAFRELQASIDAGLGGDTPASDSDFASLHDDPRWLPLIASFEAAHPELAALKIIRDQTIPVVRRFAAGRRAMAAGVSVADTSSLFNQYYANQAQAMGEYDEASRIYGWPRPVDDAVAAGFTNAVDAVPVVLAQAHGRRAVFLNESHGQSQTRAANYALLAGLRADGFNVLAMETLSSGPTIARSADHCSSTTMLDAELPTRGYATVNTGYYSADPVYAEMIREALRLGFRLVAYDNRVADGVPAREQNQAENLACVFKDDPSARLVVFAGFSHIAEGKDFWVPGGAMAARFKMLSGIDPLSVDTTTQLYLDPAKLAFADAGAKAAPVSFALQDANGANYGTENFDLALYVPAPAHREDGKASWLALGGTRAPNRVDVKACDGISPCIIQARRVGEHEDAIPADVCVVATSATGCSLFLRPGNYEVTAVDGAETVLDRKPLAVGKR